MVNGVVDLVYIHRRLISKYFALPVCYIAVLLVSSVHLLVTLFINAALLYYFLTRSVSTTYTYAFVLAIFNASICCTLVSWYAEMLPWEIGFLVMFHIISAIYLFWFRQLSKNDSILKRNVFYLEGKSYVLIHWKS